MVDADPQVTERFMEALRRGDEKCRECKHARYIHGMAHNGGPCSDRFLSSVKSVCKCIEFVPSDNLEYVEYLAKKRGLI